MSLKDQIPDTEQGIKTFQMYAENQLKELKLNIKRMEMLLEECQRRLEKFKNAK
jgi:archaellum component FlaC